MKSISLSLRLALAVAVTLLLDSRARADTIILNSGQEIIGTVTLETAEYVKIEVEVSPTIKDEKTIQRADIAEVRKLTEEDLAFQKVQALVPTRSLLTATDYDNMIRSHPERFLLEYPESKYKAEIEKILAVLQEEKAKTDQGSIKLEGTWLSPDDQKRDRAGMEAQKLFLDMRNKAAAGEYTGALRDFDEIEKNYQGTPTYLKAVDAALKVLASHAAEVNRTRGDFEFRMKKRQEDLLLLPEHERAKNEELFKADLERHKKAVEAEKKGGYKWLTVNPNSADSLKATTDTIATEAKRLSELDRDKHEKAVSLFTKAQSQLDKGDAPGAKKSVDEARKMIAQGAVVAQFDKAVERLAAEQLAAAERAKETESDKAIGAMKDYGAIGTKEVDLEKNPLEKMIRQRQEKEAAKNEAAAGQARPKPTSQPKPAAAQRTTAPAPVPQVTGDGGGLSITHIAIIAAILLAVVTVVAKFVYKPKAKG